MQSYAKVFCEYMDNNGIRYTVQKENVIKVVYNGDNLETIPVYVIFDEDNDPLVSFKCWDIANFKNKEAEALVVCNSLNCEWRWVKFRLDSDKDIVASIDAIIDLNTCGKECLSLVKRVVNIVDDAYPEIAKAKWA